MGDETVTIQSLEIIEVDLANNCILVKGNIPGPKNSLVIIKSAVKSDGKPNKKLDLVDYNEVIEEPVVEAAPAVEEVTEEEVQEETAEEVAQEETTTEETPVEEPVTEEVQEEESTEEVAEETTEEPTEETPKEEVAE